jgi:hypothetical protein
MTVVGTRPEIIRLSRVIAALDRSEAIHHILMHTGQNYDYELNQIFFEDLGIRKPDYFLDAAGANAAATIGQIIINIDPLLEQEQPDALPGAGRHQLLSLRHTRQEAPHPHLPHGGRKPLLRPARARRDQPQDRGPYQRHQPLLQRHLARVPAARRPARRPRDQDRQPHV